MDFGLIVGYFSAYLKKLPGRKSHQILPARLSRLRSGVKREWQTNRLLKNSLQSPGMGDHYISVRQRHPKEPQLITASEEGNVGPDA